MRKPPLTPKSRLSILMPVRRTVPVLLCLAALALPGCESTTSGSVSGNDRRQLLLVSSDQLNQMAEQAYAKLKAESTQQGTLNTDPALLQRVRAIAARLEPQTGHFRADAPGWKWEVNVISKDEVNAFCMPGG